MIRAAWVAIVQWAAGHGTDPGGGLPGMLEQFAELRPGQVEDRPQLGVDLAEQVACAGCVNRDKPGTERELAAARMDARRMGPAGSCCGIGRVVSVQWSYGICARQDSGSTTRAASRCTGLLAAQPSDNQSHDQGRGCHISRLRAYSRSGFSSRSSSPSSRSYSFPR